MGIHGRTRMLLLVALLVAAPGCGTRSEGPDAARPAAEKTAEPAKRAATGGAKKTAPAASKEDERLGTRTDRVRLKDAGCVEFEPHWVILAPGQSLTWTSELKAPVTIHVSSGAFAKDEFVVRPGASVSTGPSRAAGTYTIWTSPAACQGPPLGVRGSGPGVTVEAAAR